MTASPIIFFDGVCGLCNRFVDGILRRDRRAIFRFAPLQGKAAAEHLGALASQPESWTIIYVDEQGRHERSSAVLRILCRLGGFYKLYGIFLIIPSFIRDAVYAWIARNRYRWFGKREACRLPTPAERDRFLS